MNFKGISILQKEKIIKQLNAICQCDASSTSKDSAVREVTGRGGIKFLVKESPPRFGRLGHFTNHDE